MRAYIKTFLSFTLLQEIPILEAKKKINLISGWISHLQGTKMPFFEAGVKIIKDEPN